MHFVENIVPETKYLQPFHPVRQEDVTDGVDIYIISFISLYINNLDDVVLFVYSTLIIHYLRK